MSFKNSSKKPDANVLVLINKGDMLASTGRYDEALINYNKALETDPELIEVWNNRGLALVKLDRLPEALESYDRALEIDPTSEKIWRNKGLALVRMGEKNEPIDLRKIALSLDVGEKISKEPEQNDAPLTQNIQVTTSEKPALRKEEISLGSKDYLAEGNSMFSIGKFKEAVDSFNKALEMFPENTIAWNNKGLAFARLGSFDEAVVCYDKALEIDPRDKTFLNNKADALYRKGNFKGALKFFGLAFEMDPDDSTSINGMEICIKSLKNSMKLSTAICLS